MNKSSLWPTEIYNFKSETIDNDKIKEIILEKEKEDDARYPVKANSRGSRGRGIGHGTSKDSLLTEDCFSEITDFLFDCTLAITEDLYRDGIKFCMTDSWANVKRDGDHSLNHIHPNSHWGCAYYVTETYESPIYFSDPRIRKHMYEAYGLERENKYSNTMGPAKNYPGEVLFFPAWLEHAVSNNLNKNPRISISANFTVYDGNNLTSGQLEKLGIPGYAFY